MQQIVISPGHSRFSLHNEVIKRLCELGHAKASEIKTGWKFKGEIARNDPLLVQAVSELIEETREVPVWNKYAGLVIIEIPDGVEWQIEDYDGAEWVAEKHRTWEHKDLHNMMGQLLNKRAGKEYLNKGFE